MHFPKSLALFTLASLCGAHADPGTNLPSVDSTTSNVYGAQPGADKGISFPMDRQNGGSAVATSLRRRGLTNAPPPSEAIRYHKEFYGHYTSPIAIGTPAQSKLKIMLDTGSSDLWMNSRKGSSVRASDTYFPEASSTAVDLKNISSITYGDGTKVVNRWYTDIITFNSLTTRLAVGLSFPADNPGVDPVDNAEDSVGLIGFAWPERSTTSNPTPMQAWRAAGKIQYSMFAIRAPYAIGNKSVAGEMTIGGYNSARFNPKDLQYVKVPIWPGTNEHRWWTAVVTEMSLGSQKWKFTVSQNATTKKYNGDAIFAIDSGASFLALYTPYFTALGEAVGGKLDEDWGVYAVDCAKRTKLPPLNFVISGKTYSIKNTDYIGYDPAHIVAGSNTCYLEAFDFGSAGGKWPMLLGDTFMKGRYIIFDYDNARTGIAPII